MNVTRYSKRVVSVRLGLLAERDQNQTPIVFRPRAHRRALRYQTVNQVGRGRERNPQ